MTVFDCECDNLLLPLQPLSKIYSKCYKNLIDDFLNGENRAIFVYGGSNSGRSYSIYGTNKDPGLLPLTFNYLFKYINDDLKYDYSIGISYFEIYNEKINDLLHPEILSNNINIQKNEKGETIITGIEEETIDCESTIYNLLEQGSIHRITGANNINEKSSRSHAIFTIYISVIHCDGTVSLSKLHLVDLAGSERTKEITTKSDRFVESVAINQGLLALGKVILCLSKISQGANIDHIPYRESKLTRLLEVY